MGWGGQRYGNFLFYLNYVGCKVFWEAKVPPSYRLSFIWTMWDVKDGGLGVKMNWAPFYLNYVGCKGRKRKSSYRVSRSCFIWTMWDVKCAGTYPYMPWDSCFIWTMWDVKAGSFFLSSSSNVLFYLNYVGCKGVQGKPVGIKGIGFIWTMWDVKI